MVYIFAKSSFWQPPHFSYTTCTVASVAQVHLLIVNIITVIKSNPSAEQFLQLCQDKTTMSLCSDLLVSIQKGREGVLSLVPKFWALSGKLNTGTLCNFGSVTGLEPKLGEQGQASPTVPQVSHVAWFPAAWLFSRGKTPSHCFLGLRSPTVHFCSLLLVTSMSLWSVQTHREVTWTTSLYGSIQDLGRCLKSSTPLLSEAFTLPCPPLL